MFWRFKEQENGRDEFGRTFEEASQEHALWCLKTAIDNKKDDEAAQAYMNRHCVTWLMRDEEDAKIFNSDAAFNAFLEVKMQYKDFKKYYPELLHTQLEDWLQVDKKKEQKNTMTEKYKDRPSDEIVQIFTERIADLLSTHPITIEVKIRREPFYIDSYRNNVHTGREYHWIDAITAYHGPSKKEVEVSLFRQGIDESLDEHSVWQEAYHIQEDVYRKLGLNHGYPNDQDPYWQLWRKTKT